MTHRLPMVLLFVVIVLLMGAAMWKTREEIMRRPADAWGRELREELLRSEAQDNPGHLILNPRKLEQGRREYLPTPAPSAAMQTITTTWPEGVLSNTVDTPHRVEEPPTDWLTRHFGMVDFARDCRR